MGRFFKTILLLCTLIVALPVNAAFTVDGMNFEAIGATTARLLPRWPSYSGAINVPRTVEHDGVTYTVKEIAPQAFMNAEFLTSVKMHSSLSKIGANAFENCTQLKFVTIPSGVTEIGSRAFAGCTSLASFKFNERITEIPNGLFDGCISLKTVELPSMVSRICSYAFSRTSLEKITINPAVKTVEQFAFDGCSNLKVVSISDLSAWCDIDFFSIDDNPLRVARALLLNGDTLKTLIIPEGVEHIKPYAFVGINSSVIKFPSTLKTIDLSAFLECYFVKSVTIPNSVTEISTENMANSVMPFPNVESIVLGTGLRVVPDVAFYFCYRLTKLLLLDGIEEIGHNAFKYGRFETLVMPSTLHTLKSSFNSCSNLKSVTLNYSLRCIEGAAFGQCTKLKEIHCLMPNPDHVEFTGSKHFDGVDTKNCKLYVPPASLSAYKNNPNWKVFSNILPDIPMPDVNRNGIVDVDDVNLLINTALDVDNPGCSRTAADANHDGLIDVDDLNVIINAALGL